MQTIANAIIPQLPEQIQLSTKVKNITRHFTFLTNCVLQDNKGYTCDVSSPAHHFESSQIGNSKQSENEDNDALDLCDKYDSDELNWAGGHFPTKYNNNWEELSTDTTFNVVTNKYGCILQHSQRNVKHEL